jgi:hypothetical protein
MFFLFLFFYLIPADDEKGWMEMQASILDRQCGNRLSLSAVVFSAYNSFP